MAGVQGVYYKYGLYISQSKINVSSRVNSSVACYVFLVYIGPWAADCLVYAGLPLSLPNQATQNACPESPSELLFAHARSNPPFQSLNIQPMVAGVTTPCLPLDAVIVSGRELRRVITIGV